MFNTELYKIFHHVRPALYLSQYRNRMKYENEQISWWRHQMKTFPRYWPFVVRGIHRSPVHSPHKGQWRGPLMFSLICAWTNSWASNGNAGDLRRHRAHYDVPVMMIDICILDGNQTRCDLSSLVAPGPIMWATHGSSGNRCHPDVTNYSTQFCAFETRYKWKYPKHL